jgi:hypothetical protein
VADGLTKVFRTVARQPGLTGALRSLVAPKRTTKTAVDNLTPRASPGELLPTTHDMTEVSRLAERAALIDHGRLVYDGALAGLRDRSRLQWRVHVTVEHRLVLDKNKDFPGLRLVHDDGEQLSYAPDGAPMPPTEEATTGERAGFRRRGARRRGDRVDAAPGRVPGRRGARRHAGRGRPGDRARGSPLAGLLLYLAPRWAWAFALRHYQSIGG